MNEILRTGGRRLFRAIAVFVMILITVTPMAVNAAGQSLQLTVKQIFTTSSPSAENTFTYRLKPLEEGNPMPAGSTAEGYTFAITGNATASIGPLSFSRQGIFQYELFQVTATVKPGYTLDKRTYAVMAHVDAALNVELVVVHENGTKANAIEFVNRYGTVPSDPALMVDPPVKKTVSGNPDKASAFVFKLTAKETSDPMPTGSANGAKTIQITGSGEAAFGKWSYDKEGVYYYTVSEVNTGEKGYTYDTVVYTITDVVKEENGQLVVSRVVANDTNKRVTTLGFINKYSRSGSGSGTGPKTGDDAETALYVTLLAVGGIVAVGATIYLIAGRKRKKTSP